MPYTTALPGIDEARLDKLLAMVQGAVTGLNTALAVGGQTPMTWTTGQVVIGDNDRLPSSRISIVGGGEQDGQDMESEPYLMPTLYQNRLSTNLYVYLHTVEEFKTVEDADIRAAMFERAEARIADHLRKRVFNDPSNTAITLASKEVDGTNFDSMKQCFCRQVFKGMVPKSFAGSLEVRCVHLVHTGVIVS